MNCSVHNEIQSRVAACPVLGSLRSISEELSALSQQRDSALSQIADVIARDPSLTARLLRVVNSVYGGLAIKINNIEEAILFLGLRQVRQLSLATRVIDECELLQDGFPRLDWNKLWRHSIGVGVISREILAVTNGFFDDDIDYIAGLLHNIGKLVMAHSFPEEFLRSLSFKAHSTVEFFRKEKAAFGWTHADLGACYLERHNLSEEIIDVARFHHDPENAPSNTVLAAAVQVADCLTRYAGVECGIEDLDPVEEGDWEMLSGWRLLFDPAEPRYELGRASLLNSVERLPFLLHGLI